MKHEESRIQYEIVKYFQSVGIFVCSIPNEGSTDARRTMMLVSMGLRTGASDLIVILQNRVIFLEVKTAIGKQSPAQLNFQQKVTALGHEYKIVRSLEDAKRII